MPPPYSPRSPNVHEHLLRIVPGMARKIRKEMVRARQWRTTAVECRGGLEPQQSPRAGRPLARDTARDGDVHTIKDRLAFRGDGLGKLYPYQMPYGPSHRSLQCDSEFLKVVPQHGSGVLCSHHPTLLEQGNDLLHKGVHISRPDSLADGKAIAADLFHGAGETVRNAFGRADERGRVEADLTGRNFPQGWGLASQIKAVELTANALDRLPLQ